MLRSPWALARDLRARAQEILARAETMYDTDAEQTMRDVAARHEELAQRVEHGPVRRRTVEDAGDSRPGTNGSGRPQHRGESK
jgi:hypothetical protein